MRAIEKFARDFAHAVELLGGDDVFVRGDLEHAVTRGVDDRLSRAHMLFAELLDDFCAGGGLVADGFFADLFFELGNEFRRKTISQWPVVVSFPGERVAPFP
jgi:hypothetical protein